MRKCFGSTASRSRDIIQNDEQQFSSYFYDYYDDYDANYDC